MLCSSPLPPSFHGTAFRFASPFPSGLLSGDLHISSNKEKMTSETSSGFRTMSNQSFPTVLPWHSFLHLHLNPSILLSGDLYQKNKDKMTPVKLVVASGQCLTSPLPPSLHKTPQNTFRHRSVWLLFWLRYQAIISNLLTSFHQLAPNPDISKTIVNIQETLMNVTHLIGDCGRM